MSIEEQEARSSNNRFQVLFDEVFFSLNIFFFYRNFANEFYVRLPIIVQIINMNNKLTFYRKQTKKSKHLFEMKIFKRRIYCSSNKEFIWLFSTGFVIDPQNHLYQYWLAVISFAVAYNFLFIPARYAFNELNKKYQILWLSLDYTCDLIYLIDSFVQSRTGRKTNIHNPTSCLFFKVILVMDCFFEIIMS